MSTASPISPPLRSTVRVPLLLTLLAAGCGPPATPVPAPPGPEELEVGLRPAIQLEGEPPQRFVIAERLAHHNVPGVSVAVMDGGEIAWARGWGTADLETGAPVTPGTLFQAASISKPVAALAAMALVEEGAIELDGPVNRHLTTWQLPGNGFTADSAVSLRGILTHTAGLTVWGFPGYRKDRPFAEGRPVASNAEVLEGLGNTDPVRVYKVPGTSWQYSGGGYTVMEQMLEDVSGRPFHEVAAGRVLEPAGMTRSTFTQPLPDSLWTVAARGHRSDGSEVAGGWHNYPEQAAAGLWTTPSDLLLLSRHLRTILDDGTQYGEGAGASAGPGAATPGVVSAETLRAMLVPHRSGEEGFGAHGLGFAIGGSPDDPTFGHGGSNAGFRAQWIVYQDRGQGAVVMTNGDQGGALVVEILRGLAELYDWPDFRPEVRSHRRLTPDELRPYEGGYRNEGGTGPILTLRGGDGALVLQVEDRDLSTLHAVPDQEDTFFDAGDGQVLAFQRDADGRVTGVLLGGRTRFVRVE